ncbi:MAG: TerC family protein [Verrucomicrobiota bacterium]|nr:TerC family protein [Chthoniobacterales bacterium]MDQ3413531.1 TerC family protein [Verrucomicrobiota bacterium]
MTVSIWFWVAFHLGVLIALAVDLFSDRGSERISLASAVRRSLLWVGLSLGFNALVWWWQGPDQAVDFFTCYLIEYSLSVDNIFVFGLIFAYFRVPPRYEHRVLIWGILGALIMRATMIGLGVALVSRFHFVLYVFGGFLLITGVRMLFSQSQPIDLEHSFILRVVRRLLPVTSDYHGPKFIALVRGRRVLTPLALVLIVIEVMDLVFAVDSIPAVLAITRDTFIVYTSNICAILGLRSLYFLLANLVARFVFLRYGLAIILCFVGLKMLVEWWIEIPSWLSLLIIVAVLSTTTVASLFATRKGAASATP